MSAAAPLLLVPDDLAELRRWARSSQLPAVLVQRARILLLAAEGITNTEIAERVGVSRPTGIACCGRYVRRGLAAACPTGLDRDDPRQSVELVGPKSCRHPQPATAQAWDHALVNPAAGP
jgi:hypothetical protein